jgi:hypothetical protein
MPRLTVSFQRDPYLHNGEWVSNRGRSVCEAESTTSRPSLLKKLGLLKQIRIDLVRVN